MDPETHKPSCLEKQLGQIKVTLPLTDYNREASLNFPVRFRPLCQAMWHEHSDLLHCRRPGNG